MAYEIAPICFTLVLVSLAYKEHSVDAKDLETPCLYKCGGVEYNLEELDKSVKIVIQKMSELVTLERSFVTFKRGNSVELEKIRKSIEDNSLISKISHIEKENEVLKEELEKEKTVRISLQGLLYSVQDSLNRTQSTVREVNEKVKKFDFIEIAQVNNLNRESIENRLESLEGTVRHVLENQPHLHRRLNSVENLSALTVGLLGNGTLVEKVHHASNTMVSLSKIQSEQRNSLNHLEEQMRILENGLSNKNASWEQMSRRMENLDRKLETTQQKQLTVSDRLDSQMINHSIMEAQTEEQKLLISTILYNISKLNDIQTKSEDVIRTTTQNVEMLTQNIIHLKEVLERLISLTYPETEFPQWDGTEELNYTSSKETVLQGVCKLPKEPGPCMNYTPKWYFDLDYGGCARFWYGGCGGNGNVFNSQEDCNKTCVEPEGRALCLLPATTGPCEGSYSLWYYDSFRKQCFSFNYGGCLGNSNRFKTRKICENFCEANVTRSKGSLSVTPTASTEAPAETNETCEDNKFFANCELIVKGKYCIHKYYRKNCCQSCTRAGQLTR